LETYLAALHVQWQSALAGLAPPIAQHLVGQEIEYVFEMRYFSNTLRIWLTLKVCRNARVRSLGEDASPKDRWISSEGVEVVTHPPVPDTKAEEQACALFSGHLRMARSPNPRVPWGSIALVAINNNKVYEPSSTLGRTHASRQKQEAFNKSVRKKGRRNSRTELRACRLFDVNDNGKSHICLRECRPTNLREATSRWSTMDPGIPDNNRNEHNTTRHWDIKSSVKRDL
jgi:hypothetical protein